jgi:hypothetical protein
MSEAQACEWIEEDFDGAWHAFCGGPFDLFQFNEGGPVENRFRFCPYCGHALKEVPHVAATDDEDEDAIDTAVNDQMQDLGDQVKDVGHKLEDQQG